MIIISVMAFIAVFSLIVVVHELGHFIAARRAGIKVYEFSIGFPFSPRVLTLFHNKETAFTLRALPIGGFVSFSRQGDEGAKGLFCAPAGKRALVYSAGSLFNIALAFLIFVFVFVFGRQMDFIDAVMLGAGTVWKIVAGSALLFVDILAGRGALDAVSGPVGIAAMAGKAATNGFFSLCYLAGALSASLGIINLLPLPGLDGGHLAMLSVESVRKKPVSLRTYQAVTLAGLASFLLLTAALTYKDIAVLMA